MHSLYVNIQTFMEDSSIFLSPSSLQFTLSRCREHIPCYQSWLMYVLKIKVKKHSSVPGDCSFYWYRSLTCFVFSSGALGKTLSLTVFSSADYHPSGTILTIHFWTRVLERLDLVSSLPIVLSCTNQINSARRTQDEIDVNLSNKQTNKKRQHSSQKYKGSHSQRRWTGITCCRFIIKKCRPNFSPWLHLHYTIIFVSWLQRGHRGVMEDRIWPH